MNFLETLTAEWYEYNGYFCRTNIRFGALAGGGNTGEMDVVAYHPQTKEFIHIECSSDAWSWEKKQEVFKKKFGNAAKYYKDMFLFEIRAIRKIAITAFSKPRHNAGQKMNFGKGIETILIPDFITDIASSLSEKNPWGVGISEQSYPLLRAIQYGTFYLTRKMKKEIRDKNKKLIEK